MLPPVEYHRGSFGSQVFDSPSVAGGRTNAMVPAVGFVACFGALLQGDELVIREQKMRLNIARRYESGGVRGVI